MTRNQTPSSAATDNEYNDGKRWWGKIRKICRKCLSFNWKISKVVLYHQILSADCVYVSYLLRNTFYNNSIFQFVLNFWLFDVDFKVFDFNCLLLSFTPNFSLLFHLLFGIHFLQNSVRLKICDFCNVKFSNESHFAVWREKSIWWNSFLPKRRPCILL